VKKPAKWTPRETPILKGIEQALKWDPRVMVWRSNAGGVAKEHNGKRRFIQFGVTGQADLTGLVRRTGQRIEIEVKRPGGKQSIAQKIFETQISGAGGLYLLVTSINETLELLDRHVGPKEKWR